MQPLNHFCQPQSSWWSSVFPIYHSLTYFILVMKKIENVKLLRRTKNYESGNETWNQVICHIWITEGFQWSRWWPERMILLKKKTHTQKLGCSSTDPTSCICYLCLQLTFGMLNRESLLCCNLLRTVIAHYSWIYGLCQMQFNLQSVI